MASDQHETKEALLQAAGPLFADLGFDGASTRAIAKRANTNMASIGYHFSGKENLYLETLRSALSHKCTWSETIGQALELTITGVSVHEALRDGFRQRLNELFGDDHPIWHTRLIIRALLEPSPSMKAMNRERLNPEFTAVTEVARTWNPSLTQAQAMLWANSLFGQEVFYLLAQNIILEMEEWEEFPAEYLDEVADHVACLMSAALWPDNLNIKESQ